MINYNDISEYLDKFSSQNLLRILNHYTGIDFSSNDYLGLSKNSDSMNAGIKAVQKFGTGSTGSRLLSGNKQIFEEFEERIAIDKHSETSLIFNSGYVANLSVIATFSDLGYVIIFDKLNHASMYRGVNRNQLPRFNHLKYDQLENILEKHKDYPKKLIASETVFGMDGDTAELKILSELAERYDAVLYLDEAHATGLYGKHGYGLSTNSQLHSDSTIVMGTFSKALASCGAYVACPNIFKQYLVQTSKEFIYSTALSPFCVGVAEHNWKLLPSLDGIRKEILTKSDYLRNKLSNLGYKYIGSGTNIISVLFDSTENMLHAHEKLLDNGIIVSAIRRPTSPSPRLRIAVTAMHSYDDLDSLFSSLQ